jgi:hypothetical protein
MSYKLNVLSTAISSADNVRPAYADLTYISFLKLFFYLLSFLGCLASYNFLTHLKSYIRSAYFAYTSLYYIRYLGDLLFYLVFNYIFGPPIFIYFYI